MNQTRIVDAQVVADPPVKPLSPAPAKHPLELWQRLLLALSILIGFAVAGGCVWMMGLLMFTFSLDGVNSMDLPKWLDKFMLIVWPVSIGLVALVPAVLVACGWSWRWWIGSVFLTSLISLGIFVTGVITVFTSL